VPDRGGGAALSIILSANTARHWGFAC
jgi:hypothetical protein